MGGDRAVVLVRCLSCGHERPAENALDGIHAFLETCPKCESERYDIVDD